ncbi:MAG: phosphotransferase [bacterium]|nr:phosphotransferase [bacterium]MCP4905429.1 phosphotransferase [bacterium]MDP7298805.1 phosphotransferase [Myxococcota bacterium]HJO25134.1 phosphotransferase [Myxococcota bacterium]
MSRTARIELPDALRAWVERETGSTVVASASHHAGASRSAWNLEVEAAGAVRRLFLLKDKRDGGGSIRDAAVLRALAETGIPVPEVVAADKKQAVVVLSRLPGRSDFPAADEPQELRERTAAHLMALTAKLHALDPRRLRIAHLALPETPEDCARRTLTEVRGALRALGEAADPFFQFALNWLEANAPNSVEHYSLVHSDMGPGNFLFEEGRVTGIIDWEVAHFGDPMEDLAAIAVRDMATPVGSLAKRFDEYAACSGNAVDLPRVHYYRALVLVRNSLMIGLGIAQPSKQMDIDEMTMYQTLLVRAAALVLCDNLGIERPDQPPPVGDPTDAERVDVSALLGRPMSSLPDGASIDAALRDAVAGDPTAGAERGADLARFFALRLHRVAQSHKALLGVLFERLPQLLVPR